jgi:hypothetical protein
MYAFWNHIHVTSVEEHLTTYDNGVAATFEQTSVSKLNTTTKCGCSSLIFIH